jgi:hypothetical protein
MLTLYLVSALQTDADVAKYGLEGRDGHYLKVGITFHEDPLKRDPARYQEAFRALRFEDSSAKVLETAIARVFGAVGPVRGVREGLQYLHGVEYATRVYDFFVEELEAQTKAKGFLSQFPFDEPARTRPIDYRAQNAEAMIQNERWRIKESREDAGKSAFARTFHRLRLRRIKAHPTEKTMRWDRYFNLLEAAECPQVTVPVMPTPMW